MSSELASLLAFAILTGLLLLVAYKRRLFSLPPSKEWFFPIRWYHVIAVFSLYFLVVWLLVPLLSVGLRGLGIQTPSIEGAVWLNFLSSLLIIGFIGLYLFLLPKEISQKIWRQSKKGVPLSDIQFSAIVWLLSFPAIIFCNQLLDFLLQFFFHIPLLPEQLAVRFLKMTFDTPAHFFLTSIAIALCAPVIEEFLFRGFLQSFIRQHLSNTSSIVITALCFSSFHYSPEQGVANLSIIVSLFLFALILGYVYDRRQSLVAPIALHALFNTINIINLYFLGGFPRGPYL